MINKDDLIVERIRGSGPGGQHRNKTASCVKLTHKPTGTTVRVDGRNQHHNYREALKELERRLDAIKHDKLAQQRKQRRDTAIKDDTTIRTYNYKTNVVTDHRSGKKASLKEVVNKGRIDLLKPDSQLSQEYDM